MVRFSERGIQGFDELELVIGKMLAKEPADRYAALEECLRDISAIRPSIAPINLEIRSPALEDAPSLKAFAATLAPTPFEAPSASVNYGGAGVAYALLKAAHALDERSLVQAADMWASHARAWMDTGPSGGLCARMGITPEVVGPYASLHRVEGVALVEALVAHSQLDTLALRRLCMSFLTGIHKAEAPLEFILGKAGMVNTIQQLSYLVEENEPLLEIGREVCLDILLEISSFPELGGLHRQ
jgi:serine/threonine-protein kinase